MAISINKSDLSSRTVRNKIGLRKMTVSLAAEETDEGGIISKIWEGLKGVTNWIIGTIRKLISGKINLTSLWGLFVQTVQFMWTFNWNITDQQIDQQIKSQFAVLNSMVGESLGESFGWAVCGALPGLVIARFNKPLGVYILKQVGEEAFEEISAQMAAIVQTLARATVQGFLLWYFKTIRRLTKLGYNPVGEFFLRRIFGDEWFDNWGEKTAKPWSFASAFEDRIESIQNQALQDFVENFFEGFTDACVEAGFVVANAADSWIAEQKLATQEQLGPERVLEVQPDRTVDHEKIIVAGPQELVKPILVQTLTTHQQLDKRDVGTLVGIPESEYLFAQPVDTKLVIMMRGIAAPPWGTSKRAQITVSNVTRAKIDWALIKQAVGGVNGYYHGRFLADGMFKSGRHIKVYASTAQGAVDRVEALTYFTDDVLVKIDVTEELKKGERLTDEQLYKEPEQVFPAYFTVYNRIELLDQTRGRASFTEENRFEMRQHQIPLWTTEKPDDVEDIVARLFTRGY